METKKNSKMFLKIMHDKTILKAKIDETQEKQGFKKMVKRVSMLFFETFVPKQNDNLLLETQKEV